MEVVHDALCDNMIDKTIIDINCVKYNERMAQFQNETIHFELEREKFKLINWFLLNSNTYWKLLVER